MVVIGREFVVDETLSEVIRVRGLAFDYAAVVGGLGLVGLLG